jgi:hypothetical protein
MDLGFGATFYLTELQQSPGNYAWRLDLLCALGHGSIGSWIASAAALAGGS